MHKSQPKKKKNTPEIWEKTPKDHNALVTDFKDVEVDEMPDKEFKRMTF